MRKCPLYEFNYCIHTITITFHAVVNYHTFWCVCVFVCSTDLTIDEVRVLARDNPEWKTVWIKIVCVCVCVCVQYLMSK